MDYVSIIVGIGTGIAANLIHRYYTYNQKPKIELCDTLIKEFVNNEPLIRGKIINKGNQPVTDIKIVLYGLEYLDSEKKLKSIQMLSQYHIDFLDKFDQDPDSACDYAYRVAFRMKGKNIHKEMNKYENLFIFLKCIDTYNSSIYAKYHQVDKEKIKDCEWKFDKCSSCNTTKISEIKKPSDEDIEKVYTRPAFPAECPLVKHL